MFLSRLILLADCDDNAARERYRANRGARRAQLQPAEIVPAQAGVMAVKVCADSRIHVGLARPAVRAGDAGCEPVGKEVVANGVAIQRCVLNGETWVTTAAVKADLARDFVLVQSAEPVSGDGGYSQTRRYRLIGECPEGWNIGDSTDQQGRRVKGRSGLLAIIGG